MNQAKKYFLITKKPEASRASKRADRMASVRRKESGAGEGDPSSTDRDPVLCVLLPACPSSGLDDDCAAVCSFVGVGETTEACDLAVL